LDFEDLRVFSLYRLEPAFILSPKLRALGRNGYNLDFRFAPMLAKVWVGDGFYKSFGVSPVCFAILANILWPISSSSWNPNM
jgi:hypothetical protein